MIVLELLFYYDLYDFDIDIDLYFIWKWMCDEVFFYYNEEYDFYVLSCYEDVIVCLKDFDIYSFVRGIIMELIKGEFELLLGMFIFEDLSMYDIYCDLLRKLFMSCVIVVVEFKVWEFIIQVFDFLVGKGGFDFIMDFGQEMLMCIIGMLLGIFEVD